MQLGFDITPLRWGSGELALLDQRKLPLVEEWVDCPDVESVARAIETMIVRGAPAIGIAAAYGVAIAAAGSPTLAAVNVARERLARTRPTAVNLFWALERMGKLAERLAAERVSGALFATALSREAESIHREDVAGNVQMGRFGAAFVPDGARILTHCNAGALATGGYGTALGVIRAARDAGKKVSVFADETRPFLQGSRLTAWELAKDEIPVTVISDNMAGHLLSKGEIDLVVVGADRIARNGDAANKIGTYSVAVLAAAHDVPFYVAAPLSTIDLAIEDGSQIPIEERSESEVTSFAGVQVAPEGVGARHPAFDVTPARLIRAIFTEAGIAEPPSSRTITELFEK